MISAYYSCILQFYWIHLLVLNFSFFGEDFMVFCIKYPVICKRWQLYFFLFQFECYLFLFLVSSPWPVLKINIMLSRSGKSGYFCLILEYDVSLWVCKWPLLCWNIFPLYQLSWEFYHELTMDFIKHFFCIYWDNQVIFSLPLVNVAYHSINLWMVNYPYIPEMNPTLSECMIVLMHFWIPFANILLSNSTSMFTRYIVIFFLVASLCDFGLIYSCKMSLEKCSLLFPFFEIIWEG